ncbi:MAG: RnfABCDGE type electron transport complex subunit D [Pseudomonadota bacterium]
MRLVLGKHGGHDPRFWQIAALTSLLTIGVAVFQFDFAAWHPVVTVASALLTQAFCVMALRWRGTLLDFDPLSPAITALSLSLLLRTDALWLSALAASLAIGSKFLLRWDGRHLFNPANFALVLIPLFASGAWISPGQWGSAGLLAVAVAGIGCLVASRASRLDTTLAFLGTWAALTVGRALWLGDPWAIPLHQLQSGAILVFAFFMISDPATTPVSRAWRIFHAAAVAGLGFWLQTAWITNTGPILALIVLAPLVPVLNRFPPLQLRRTARAAPPSHSTQTGSSPAPCPADSPLPRPARPPV